MNILGDHLELPPFLIAPFYYLTGNYTLLIFQVLSIALGAIGVLRLAKVEGMKEKNATLIVAFFMSVWGINSALSFDYHNNVIGAMFVPWLFLYWRKDNWKKFTLFFILLITSKENMALWAVFLLLGMFIIKWMDEKKVSKKELIFAGFAGLYFIVALKLIIPSFYEGEYMHFKFHAMGDSMGEVAVNIVKHPQKAFSLLFESHRGEAFTQGIKTELFFVLLLSGGFVLIARPIWLLMLAPIFLQKLYNDDFSRWGLNGQYSIEFVPVLAIALVFYLKSIKDKYKTITLVVLIISTYGINLVKMRERESKWFDRSRVDYLSSKHYIEENREEFNVALSFIPEKVVISAHSSFVPHLANRDVIHMFPNVEEAEYIVYRTDKAPWPMNKEDFELKREILESSTNWDVLFNAKNSVVLKRARK